MIITPAEWLGGGGETRESLFLSSNGRALIRAWGKKTEYD